MRKKILIPLFGIAIQLMIIGFYLTFPSYFGGEPVVAAGKQDVVAPIDAPIIEKETEVEKRKPFDLLLVIDRSGSMAKNSRMDNAKVVAQAVISRLQTEGAGDRISIISFNQRATIDSGLSSDYKSIIEVVNKMKADDPEKKGGTNYEAALHKANEEFMVSDGDLGREGYVILLSDGEPNYYVDSWEKNLATGRDEEKAVRFSNDLNGQSVTNAVKEALKSASSGMQVFTIGISPKEGVDLKGLSGIAEAGKGKAFNSQTSSTIEKIYMDILDGILESSN